MTHDVETHREDGAEAPVGKTPAEKAGRRRRDKVIAASVLGLVIFAVFATSPVDLPPWLADESPDVPIFVLVALGFLAGVLLTTLLNLTQDAWSDQSGTILLVVVACAAVMFAASVRHGEILFVRAALTFLFGGAALLAADRLVQAFSRGEALEVESHWGGYGGGLGGWRLSPNFGLLLLVLAFGGVALAVGLDAEREAADIGAAGVSDSETDVTVEEADDSAAADDP